MSDSEHSTVTYTSVSFPVEDDSDIGSPGVNGPPSMPEDPYVYIMAAYQVPPSPDYIPGPEEPQSPPPLDFIPETMYPEICSPSLTRGGPEVDEEDLEEEPADYPADRDDDDDDDEDEDEEEEEEHPAPADSVPPVHLERLLALTTPPPSPLTPLSSPLPHITSSPLPILSPPPNSPTHIEIPESCLPLQKRVHFASPTPSHEVGESLAAGAARQSRPAKDDLVGAIDEIAPTTLEGVNQRVTDLSTVVEQETTIMYGIMEDAQDDQSQLRGRDACEAWGQSMDAKQTSTFRCYVITYYGSGAECIDFRVTVSRSQETEGDFRVIGIRPEETGSAEALKLLKGLQTQMVEFQRQHGPAKGPAQPDAPGEAGSSS
ncbi:hypothetical protein Tco_1563402 [Tanacetum coccineum]